MRSLAAFVVRGRWQAVMVIVGAALLAQLLLPLAYFSGAAVALVTLRLGWRQGLMVIALSLLPLAVLYEGIAAAMGGAAVGMTLTAVLWLPVWAAAQSLRRTMKPGRSVMLAALFGLLVVAGFALGSSEPVAWWQQAMQHSMAPVMEGLPQAEQAKIRQGIADLALIMTGTSAMLLSLSLVISLFIGRWWQAMLFNPGGFGDEFRRLRLGKKSAIFLLLLLLAAGFSGNAFLAQNLPMVVLLPFLLQGLAIVHGLVKQNKAHTGWLVGTYLLLFVTGPMALLLAFVGVVDNWFDFRAFFGPKGGAGSA